MGPLSIFILEWTLQVSGLLFFSSDFYPIVWQTWVILCVAVVAYVIGWLIAYAVPEVVSYDFFSLEKNLHRAKHAKTLFVFSSIAFAVVSLPTLMDIISASGSIELMRQMVIQRILERDPSYILAFYFSIFVCLTSLYAIAYGDCYSKKFKLALGLVVTVALVVSFGRTLLLMFFVGLIFILAGRGAIKKHHVVILSLFFLFLFFLIARVMNKGGDAPLAEMLAWNYKVYFLNGLACFNYFIANDFPRFEGVILAPNSIKRFFGEPEVPVIFPFVETPLPGNVYTALYPMVHDFGVVGVFVGFFLIGWVTNYFYRKRRLSRDFLYFSSLIMYPLVMIVFNDQYLLSYPLWIMVIFILLGAYILRCVDNCRRF